MKKKVAGSRCEWCGKPFQTIQRKGRPRQYCKDSCRQRAYEVRSRQRDGTLGPDEISVAMSTWRELRDWLWELTAALEDVDGDLADDQSQTAYRDAFQHLYAVASRLREIDAIKD